MFKVVDKIEDMFYHDGVILFHGISMACTENAGVAQWQSVGFPSR